MTGQRAQALQFSASPLGIFTGKGIVYLFLELRQIQCDGAFGVEWQVEQPGQVRLQGDHFFHQGNQILFAALFK